MNRIRELGRGRQGSEIAIGGADNRPAVRSRAAMFRNAPPGVAVDFDQPRPIGRQVKIETRKHADGSLRSLGNQRRAPEHRALISWQLDRPRPRPRRCPPSQPLPSDPGRPAFPRTGAGVSRRWIGWQCHDQDPRRVVAAAPTDPCRCSRSRDSAFRRNVSRAALMRWPPASRTCAATQPNDAADDLCTDESGHIDRPNTGERVTQRSAEGDRRIGKGRGRCEPVGRADPQRHAPRRLVGGCGSERDEHQPDSGHDF